MPITIHTDSGHNHRYPLFLNNAKDANDARIAHWFDRPVPISSVRNTTNRLSHLTLQILNPDNTPVVWTNMAIWLCVSTPLGDFPMKKTPISRLPDPSYYDKRIGQEDVEDILYYP
jgi:hypothetical protein